MKGETAQYDWLASVFDVSQPYLYLIVLPTLILFAFGYRNQAVIFALGAAAVLSFLALK